MGRKLPQFLRNVRPYFGVRYHDEPELGFNQTTQDDEWLGPIGKQGWVVISHDKRFHKDSLAMEAVRQHRAIVVYMDGGSMHLWDKIRLFAQGFQRIRKIAGERRGPLILRLTHSNRLIVVSDFSEPAEAKASAA